MSLAETRELDLVLKLKDQASNEMSKFSGKLDKLQPAFGKMAAAGTAAFVGIAGAVGASIAKTSDFETSMANVSTLIDTSSEDMDKMKEHVLNLSKELPVPIEELTSSLYDIRSAGIDANQAMLTLNWSAKLSAAGLSTTQEATDILTSALNSFKTEGLDAKQTADILFKTVKAGKTTISQLAISFGASAPVIAEAGVKLADFSAATAALTTTGLPASQAQMGLRQAIVALIKPTGDMESIFKKIGTKSGRDLIATSDNLGDVFKKLKEASEKNGISFEKAMGSVEGLNAATGLLGSTGESYVSTLKSMTDGTVAIDDAYKKQSETFAAQSQEFKNQINVLMITIGKEFIPILLDLLKKVQPIIEKMADWIQKNPEMTKYIILGAAALSALVAVLGTVGLILPSVITGITLLGTAVSATMTGVSLLAGVIMGPVGLVAAFAFAIIMIDKAIKAWGSLKQTQDEIKESLKGVSASLDEAQQKVGSLSTEKANEQLQKSIDKARELQKEAERLANMGFWESLGVGAKDVISKVGKIIGVNDAVISPDGNIVTTNPKDFLIATQNPGELLGSGGGGTTVNINGGYYLDKNAGEKLAESISEVLRRKLRI